jgi:DNA helicase II / ATP-dependent DNA helicase PcrA
MEQKQDILKDLNPEQKKAVIHKNGPLLIVAGAGTGKTTVITRRIAHLVLNEKVQANEILGLTFTNKASEEMVERVDQLLPMGYVDLWVSTFHSFAQRILEENGMDIGISSNVELIDSTGAWLLVQNNLDKFDLDYYKPRNNPTKFIKAMLTHFSRLKDDEISPEQYLEYAEGIKMASDTMESLGGSRHSELVSESVSSSKKQTPESSSGRALNQVQGDVGKIEADDKRRVVEIANAYHTYQELLHENNKMDFSDVINYCLKLFRERPNVLAHYQKQFKYILVDEFQDTNWAQYDLVKMLALNPSGASGLGPENNITVVADDDQSIYRFRGASMSNVIQFSKDYKDVSKISLVQNYRSGQEILDTAYDFIQLNNPNRLESAQKIDKKLVANQTEKALVEHLHAQDASSEAQVITETILEIKKKDKDATWNDFAILVRANSQTDIFEETLSLSKIPHANYSAAGLYKTPIVMNILSFFKVLDDFYESRAMFRLLNLPFLQISAEDIVKMNHHSNKKRVSLYDVVQSPQKTGVSSEKSLTEIDRLRAWIESYGAKAKQEKPSRLLLDWLNQGYMAYLKNLDAGESQEQFRLLKAFYDHIRSIESIVPDSRVHDIVNVLEQEISSGDAGNLPMDLDAGPEMVKIMTVHSAKGLEFKYVFVTNLVDRRFPTTARKEQITIPDDLVKEVIPEGDIHIEEERRLFYVAMTRAKLGLFFTSAENYGGTQKKKLSRFLKELEEVNKNFKPSENVLGNDAKSLMPKILEHTQKEFRVVLPRMFSFTQLKIFDECPFAYKMQFLLKVPLPGKFVFSYGTTMHSTLQQFMQMVSGSAHSAQADLFSAVNRHAELVSASVPGKEKQTLKQVQGDGLSVSVDELIDIYKTKWIDDWYESAQQMKEYKKKGADSLKVFYDNLSKSKIPNVKALERGFKLKIGEYIIAGKMDRVDSTGEGEVEIVDYKTGNPPKTGKLSLSDKRQLLIYQIASEEVFKEKVKSLTYYYIDSATPIEFIGTEKEKDEVKEWVTKTIESIKSHNFAVNPKQHFCDYCEYFLDLS